MAKATTTTVKYKVTADELNVRETPKGRYIKSVFKNDVVEYIATSPDEQWLKIKKGNLIGWASYRYLLLIETSVIPNVNDGVTQILNLAATAAITKYSWIDRGKPKPAYIKGMALVYARVYCKLKAGDPHVTEMAKACVGNKKDSLTHYAQIFKDLGMSNEASGVDTLRHLFILLIGLGMRESSGKFCEGMYAGDGNKESDTAEAGLFQTSYNVRSVSSLLPQLFQKYLAQPNGFLEVFSQNVSCKAADAINYGTGDGFKFQKLSKECPAFAAEFTALAMRNVVRHWAPIRDKEAEVRPECNKFLVEIEHIVDTTNICPL